MGINILSQKSLLVILAYAPAGLGHLRVTDALYQGLPKEVNPILLGSQDKLISFFHRLTSIHPFTRNLMEWAQRGKPEDIFTFFHVFLLRSQTRLLYEQFITLLDQRIEQPKIVLVVATHFGLAHQLAQIKEKIESERKIKIILVLQVTDDSPQHIWYVEKADMIVVPSQKTKDELIKYSKKKGLREVNIEVVSYPVSPCLTKNLSDEKYKERIHQLSFRDNTPIYMAVPISGAAVGTDFITKIIDSLAKKSERFKFYVMVRIAPFTKNFVSQMMERPFVNLFVSTTDRGIVDKYEEVYLNNLISLEITKPSEQTFKTLINPNKVGGPIMLFTHPVGRQEYDNLDFLKRHHLICSLTEQRYLWEKAKHNSSLESLDDKKLLENAKNWRGIFLPEEPDEAANFIWWCLKNNLFSKMALCRVLPRKDHQFENELFDNGVTIFWEKVTSLLERNIQE